MRLFTAVDLTAEARSAIDASQHALRAALGDAPVRWVRAEQMHLTLVFVGEVDETMARAIVEQMSMPIGVQAFSVELDGLGVFPERGAPRVLWLGTSRGADALAVLHREVSRRLETAGVALEPRPFHPHLTLARWRRHQSRGRPRVPAALPRHVPPVAVGAVTLYRSRLSSSGSTYTALTRAALQCP